MGLTLWSSISFCLKFKHLYINCHRKSHLLPELPPQVISGICLGKSTYYTGIFCIFLLIASANILTPDHYSTKVCLFLLSTAFQSTDSPCCDDFKFYFPWHPLKIYLSLLKILCRFQRFRDNLEGGEVWEPEIPIFWGVFMTQSISKCRLKPVGPKADIGGKKASLSKQISKNVTIYSGSRWNISGISLLALGRHREKEWRHPERSNTYSQNAESSGSKEKHIASEICICKITCLLHWKPELHCRWKELSSSSICPLRK